MISFQLFTKIRLLKLSDVSREFFQKNIHKKKKKENSREYSHRERP